MSRSYFSTEGGMTAMPGAGGEESPQQKSWRDMVKDGTYDDYVAARIAEAKAARGESAEADKVMDNASEQAGRYEHPEHETSSVDNEDLTLD